MRIKLIKKNNEAGDALPTFGIWYSCWQKGYGKATAWATVKARDADAAKIAFDKAFYKEHSKDYSYEIKEIKKVNRQPSSSQSVEIKSGPHKGELRYTPAAKAVAKKVGADLLIAILAAGSDEAWSQADENEWKDTVDTDHSLEWNTCQCLDFGLQDIEDKVKNGSIKLKGDSGKDYTKEEGAAAYSAILALGDDDRFSLIYNNQPRHYDHIQGVTATAMDMAADGEDGDWESKSKPRINLVRGGRF